MSATRAASFKDGTIKVLAQEDTEGYPALNKQGVPLTRDFAKTDEQRRILDLVYSQTVFGRPSCGSRHISRRLLPSAARSGD